MMTKQRVYCMARALGADLFTDTSIGQAEIRAPKGKCWDASKTRSYCVTYGDHGLMSEIYQKLFDIMEDGLVDAPEGYDDGDE